MRFGEAMCGSARFGRVRWCLARQNPSSVSKRVVGIYEVWWCVAGSGKVRSGNVGSGSVRYDKVWYGEA